MAPKPTPARKHDDQLPFTFCLIQSEKDDTRSRGLSGILSMAANAVH